MGVKVGDKVKVLKSLGKKELKELKGKTGKVIKAESGSSLVLVEFDENIGGHNGNGVIPGVEGKDGHCWWYTKDKLEKVGEEETKKKESDKVKFKKGDRVIFSGSVKGNYVSGKKGTVLGVPGSHPPILVEFDENVGGHGGNYPKFGLSGKEGHCWFVYPEEITLIIEETYKVGDRVVYCGKTKSMVYLHEGETKGTVLGVCSSYPPILVEFDEYIKGHNGNGVIPGLEGKDGHCWFVTPEEISVVKESPAGFVVEDKVEVKESIHLQKGANVQILHGINSGQLHGFSQLGVAEVIAVNTSLPNPIKLKCKSTGIIGYAHQTQLKLVGSDDPALKKEPKLTADDPALKEEPKLTAHEGKKVPSIKAVLPKFESPQTHSIFNVVLDLGEVKVCYRKIEGNLVRVRVQGPKDVLEHLFTKHLTKWEGGVKSDDHLSIVVKSGEPTCNAIGHAVKACLTLLQKQNY